MRSFKFWLTTIIILIFSYNIGIYLIYLPLNDKELYILIEVMILSILLNVGIEYKISTFNKYQLILNISIQLIISYLLAIFVFQFSMQLNSALTSIASKKRVAFSYALQIVILFQYAYMFSILIFRKKNYPELKK